MKYFDRIFRYYLVWVKCNNCDESYDMSIPKGHKVDEFLEKAKCRYCGCETLELK